jgi:hypothetical protein
MKNVDRTPNARSFRPTSGLPSPFDDLNQPQSDITRGRPSTSLKLDTLDTADNVHIESWVAQEDIFPFASMVIRHGGSGTTFGALAAGVPLIFLPTFADQPTNAALIEGAGAGIIVGDGSGSVESNSESSHTRMPLLQRRHC